MKSKIIAQTLLEPEHFLFASSQSGPYIPQPTPNISGNSGEFRLITYGDSEGNISDFVYNGIVTKNSTGTTYLQDSNLRMFGDQFFWGSTITFTAGAISSGATTITNFYRAGATIFWETPLVSSQVGDTYTLTQPYTSKSIYLWLLTGGDAGDARFLWSKAAGSQNTHGRMPPSRSIWLAPTSVVQMTVANQTSYPSRSSTSKPYLHSPICQASNNDFLQAYMYLSSGYDTIYVKRSNNSGLNYYGSDDVYISVSELFVPSTMIRLKNNLAYKDRIVLYGFNDLSNYAPKLRAFYSDNNGLTFTDSGVSVGCGTYTTSLDNGGPNVLTELSDGRIILVYANDTAGGFYTRFSNDGLTFTDASYNSAFVSGGDMGTLSVVENKNNTIYMFYLSSGDLYTAYTTDGTNWFSSTSIDTTSTGTFRHPFGYRDIDNQLYCFVEEYISSSTKAHIVFYRSIDDGASWQGKQIAVSELSTGYSCEKPYVTLVDGHDVVLSYISRIWGGVTNMYTKQVRMGMWGYYDDVSTVPVAPNSIEQKLCNDIGIRWEGGSGSAGSYLDTWTFKPEYRYAASNMVSDSPNTIWKSDSDGVTCELIIDMGASRSLLVDGVALFNCNFSTCSVELNYTNLWTSPYESTAVSFVLGSGVFDGAISGNVIRTDSTIANFNDHELKDYFVKITSGVSNGYAFKILDNTHCGVQYNVNDSTNQLYIDINPAITIATGTTFDIYQKDIWTDMPSTSRSINRYMRIYIPAQGTPDGYYKIGNLVAGKVTTLDNTWDWSNYGIEYDTNVSFLRSISGGMTPIDRGEPKRKFNLVWDKSENSYKQIRSIANYCRGKNLALIPESNSPSEVYLVKQVGSIRQDFQYGTRWNLSLQFEESI